MDCPGPPFAGNHNPGRYGRVFPSFGCFFSVFCWLDSSEKMLARSSFHRKGIKKVLLSGIVIAYLTLPVMKELKDENNSKAVVHDVC